MNEEERKEKVKNLNKWLEDFDKVDSPFADVNLIGESRDYVEGFKDGISEG